ncbi:hypothetical protein [Nocardiopsis chromatogenes]|uniref:hypothetical protein n=1 Tax=Nocardiopsis chromatogenes TaxID=280239 RepID=UPI000346D9EB|nr:hypothetical protein [Nocardiopsis chromatogenes]
MEGGTDSGYDDYDTGDEDFDQQMEELNESLDDGPERLPTGRCAADRVHGPRRPGRPASADGAAPRGAAPFRDRAGPPEPVA